MAFPPRITGPRREGMDGVLAAVAVAAVVALTIAANARRRVSRRVAALRPTLPLSSSDAADASGEQRLAEPVTGA